MNAGQEPSGADAADDADADAASDADPGDERDEESGASGASGGDAGTANGAPDAADVPDGTPRRLDFADARRRPAVDELAVAATSRLAEALERELESTLHFDVACAPGEAGRRSRDELVAGLVPGAPCVPLALSEPAGEAWLLVDRTLVFALADRRYGGDGVVVDDGRALSASERRLCLVLRSALCRALERAWAPVTALRVRDVGATEPGAAAADAERFSRDRTEALWHACPVEIDAGDGTARATVLMAHSTIATLVPRQTAPVVHRLEHAAAFGEKLAAGVRGCDVELVGVLAERGVTLGELAGLKSGDFLALDERRPVRFLAEGRAVFDARLGLDADRLCASVTRLHLSTPGD